MPDPVDTASFAELVERMNDLVAQQSAAVRRVLVQAIAGPGPVTLTDENHGGKLLHIANGGSAVRIDVHLPADATVGVTHLVRQVGPAPLRFLGDGGGTLINRLTHNGTAGQYAAVVLKCEANADGTSAIWYLDGDTGEVG